MVETINVASKSSTAELADAILNSLEAQNVAILKAIGAGAVNQAAKGIAVAQQKSTTLDANISFFSVTIEGQERSGLVFEVRKKEE